MAAGDDADVIPTPTSETPRLVIPGLRRLFVVAGFLVFAVGSSLFLYTERTDRYFAWTIATPLTAAFLGAGYLASAVFEWLAATERVWARVRVTVSAVMVFTVLTLVVTLLHVDRFHFGPEHALVTRAGTWLWTLIYGVVPVVLAVLLLAQRRAPGHDPPPALPLAVPLRALVGVQATVLLTLGASLLLTPSTAANVWPWPLTPLTAQAIAAWLLGIGTGMAHAVVENDVDRVRGAGTSNLLIAGLQLLAVARYPDDITSATKGGLYVAFLLSMVAAGLYLRFDHRAGRLVPGQGA